MSERAERTIPEPPRNPETEGFWEAARGGRLLIGRCPECQEVHYYPRAVCPFCFANADTVEACGRGTIYSYTVMRRVPVPYALAFVRLAEGVTMLTNIVDCDLDRLRIGGAVRLVFMPTEGGGRIAMFTPDDAVSGERP